jgi:hypothetical protein
MFLASTGDLAFSVSGTQIMTVSGSGGASIGISLADGGQYLGGIESAVAPTYSFTDEPGTGIYQPNAGELGLSVGGAVRVRVTTNSIIASAQQYISKIGTAANPTYAFSGTTTAGMYRAVTNGLGFAASGQLALTINHNVIRSSSANLEMADGTVGAPAYTFDSEPDMGMYKSAASHLSFAVGGTQIMTVSAGGVSISSQFSAPIGTSAGGVLAYTFNGDSDTGIFSSFGDQMDFVAGASSLMQIIEGVGVHTRAPIQACNGTAVLPAYTFRNNTGTGMYLNTSNSLHFPLSGCVKAVLDNLGWTVLDQLRISAGSAALPGIGFWADQNSGMYWTANGHFAFTVNGSTTLSFAEGSGVTVSTPLRIPDGTASVPSLSFFNDTNLGIYRIAQDRMGFAAGSSTIMVVTASATDAVQPSVDVGANLGASTLRWNKVFASALEGDALSASFADLAERYEADREYEPGTVVIVGGSKEITQSYGPGQDRVLGIISGNPGFAMNKDAGPDKTHPYVALSGRVPCKVKGPIYKGQRLVTSSAVGHAEGKSHPTAGTTIGLALEDLSSSVKGVIEITIKRC